MRANWEGEGRIYVSHHCRPQLSFKNIQEKKSFSWLGLLALLWTGDERKERERGGEGELWLRRCKQWGVRAGQWGGRLGGGEGECEGECEECEVCWCCCHWQVAPPATPALSGRLGGHTQHHQELHTTPLHHFSLSMASLLSRRRPRSV